MRINDDGNSVFQGKIYFVMGVRSFPGQSLSRTDVSRTRRFPDIRFLDETFPGQTIPGQDVSRTDDSRTKLFPDRRFPDNTFFMHNFTVAGGERVNRLIVSFKRSVAATRT